MGEAEGYYLGKGPVGREKEQKQQEIIAIYESSIIHIYKNPSLTLFQSEVKMPRLLISTTTPVLSSFNYHSYISSHSHGHLDISDYGLG